LIETAIKEPIRKVVDEEEIRRKRTIIAERKKKQEKRKNYKNRNGISMKSNQIKREIGVCLLPNICRYL